MTVGIAQRLHIEEACAATWLTSQAKLLDQFLKTNGLPQPAVVMLDAPDDVVRKRMLARHRVDDKAEVINDRLSNYHAQSEFLTDWYGSEKLLRIDATQSISLVSQQLDHLIIENVVNKPPAFATR